MTTTPVSNVDNVTIMTNGSQYGIINNPKGALPVSSLGYLYGTSKEIEVGPRSKKQLVYGGTSNHYILSHPGTQYDAFIINDGYKFDFKISFRSSDPERFIFLTESPSNIDRLKFPGKIYGINNARQLFDFLHPLRIDENSMYEAILLANGKPMTSILDVNSSPTRKRATYCYPTKRRCSVAKFFNPDPSNSNQYINISYSYLYKNSADNRTVDVCIGDYFDGNGVNEVFDVKPFLDWVSMYKVKGRQVKQFVRNFCSP